MENEECSSSDIQSVLSILDSRSPATQLLVKQAGLPQEPSEGSTALSFQILEELLPRFGVYGPVLRLVRDKLHAKSTKVFTAFLAKDERASQETVPKGSVGFFGANSPDDVYSPQFTCDESDSSSAYSRIPYFILYSRLLANRNIEAEEIQGQLDRVTGDSRERFESELEESRADTGQCRDFLREANGQMQRLLGERRSLLQYREGFSKLEAEYEEYLDSRLRQWLMPGAQDVEALPENLAKVLPPLPDDDEGARKRGAFRGTAAELSLERSLLRRHRESLEQELSILEDCAEQVTIHAHSTTTTAASGLAVGWRASRCW
ncbi:unnamed protein product [Lampetra planeri]